MYQIDNSTAAVAQPASTPAGAAGFFTDGNPASGTAATIVPAEWLNAVMMELVNVVTAGGLTPTKNVFDQVAKAIKAMGKQRVILNDTGAANAYTATNSPALLAGTWVDGVVQVVKIAHANTGPSTYAPDGLTPIPIYGLGLQPMQGGELALNGQAVLMRMTISGVNSGNPIAVLMECAGGAQQVAAGSQSNHAPNLSQFLAILATSGYFKIPVMVSGVLRTVIVQWGQATVTGGGGQAVATYPIAWPTGLLGDVAFSGFGNIVVNGVTSTLSTRQFNLTQGSSGAAAANGTTCSYIAIGW